MMEKGTEKTRSEEKIIALYKRMLKIAEEERAVITSRELERLDHYWSLKKEIMREIDMLKDGINFESDARMSSELETLVKEVIMANNINAERICNMKSDLIREITSLHKDKVAFNAYKNR